MRSKQAVFFLLLALAGMMALAQAEPKAEFYTLPNGLRVFLSEKRTVPLVHAVLAIGVGEKNEVERTCGLAHLLEHLILFGSSRSRPAAQKIEAQRQAGAFLNAHTSHDLMTVEISLPAEEAGAAAGFLRECVFEAAFLPDEAEGEKKILLEEMHQVEDNPETLGTSLLFQGLFASHPYGRPLAGSPEAIAKLGVQDLEAFYRTFFVPANCALAVVGRFDFEAMKQAIAESFGIQKERPKPVSNVRLAAAPSKRLEIKRSLDIENAHLFVGFFTPHLNHPDRLAVSILAQMLSQGRRPLLYQAFPTSADEVEALNVRTLALESGGLMLIHIVTRPQSLKRIKADLFSFLGKTSSFRFGKEDFLPGDQLYVVDYMEAARNLVISAAEDFKEEGSNLANSYASYILQNELDGKESFEERVRKVKSGDIRTVCGRYLAGRPCVVVEILPREKGQENENGKRP